MVKVAERLRRQAPQTAIQRREDAALPVREGQAHAGRPLLLDTCVYIDQMQGRAPHLVRDLLGIRTVNHGTVAIQDPMHTVGVLDPQAPRNAQAITTIGTAIDIDAGAPDRHARC